MIKFFEQDSNKKIISSLKKYFENDEWIHGKIISQFEKNLKRKININAYPSTCKSGSDALLLALLLDKKKNRDIYLTSPISYVATSGIPKFLGLEIIYIDVEKNSFLLSLDKLESFLDKVKKNIKQRIRGIINVELFGATNDLNRLRKICKKNNLSLIGDCAQSLGTLFNKKSTLDYYDFSISSFYPTKILSTYGDGGVVFLKKKYLKKCFLLKNNGHEKVQKENCKIKAINSRLDSIHAYILNEKLNKFNEILKKRKKNTDLIIKNKPPYLMEVKTNLLVDQNNYILCFLINQNIRKKFLLFMKNKKIQCKVYYNKLLSDNKVLKPILKTNLNNAESIINRLICIPNHQNLSENNLKFIIKNLNNF